MSYFTILKIHSIGGVDRGDQRGKKPEVELNSFFVGKFLILWNYKMVV